MADQLAALQAIAEDLEHSLSESLAKTHFLSQSSVNTIQRVDYMRQSLGDLAAISARICDGLEWAGQDGLDLENLKSIVKLQDSLPKSLRTENTHADHHDLWL